MNSIIEEMIKGENDLKKTLTVQPEDLRSDAERAMEMTNDVEKAKLQMVESEELKKVLHIVPEIKRIEIVLK
jgi:hypothetical protein